MPGCTHIYRKGSGLFNLGGAWFRKRYSCFIIFFLCLMSYREWQINGALEWAALAGMWVTWHMPERKQRLDPSHNTWTNKIRIHINKAAGHCSLLEGTRRGTFRALFSLHATLTALEADWNRGLAKLNYTVTKWQCYLITRSWTDIGTDSLSWLISSV